MSVEGNERKLLLFFVLFNFILGVRMGRIPKLVKEKALAEYHVSSSSIENEDPFSSSPYVRSIGSNSNNLTPSDFNLELIDEQLFSDDFDSISFDDSPSGIPSCKEYILPDNFTIDETKHEYEEKQFIVNCEEQFSNNVLERIKGLVTKLSEPITTIELGHEQSSFIRYLRWKMIDLCNTYNGGTRQSIERMNNMISHGVNININIKCFCLIESFLDQRFSW
jgi:hypothetical protein